jgi:hypothetical protein
MVLCHSDNVPFFCGLLSTPVPVIQQICCMSARNPAVVSLVFNWGFANSHHQKRFTQWHNVLFLKMITADFKKMPDFFLNILVLHKTGFTPKENPEDC